MTPCALPFARAAPVGTFLLALVLGACGSPRTPEAGAPPAPSRAEPRRAEVYGVTYEAGEHRYQVTVTGTAEAQGGPAATQGTARLRTVAFLTLSSTPTADGAQLRVTVDSFAVQGPEPRIPPPDQGAPGGAAYEVAVQSDGRTTRLTSMSLGCPGRSPIEGAMADLVVPLPSEIRVGVQWEDSVVTVSCRDGLPITTVSHHRYVADGTQFLGGRRLLRVKRMSESLIEGSQVRRGQAVGLSGSARATASLLVELGIGLVVEGEHTVQAELTLSGGDGEVPLRQLHTSRVRLVR